MSRHDRTEGPDKPLSLPDWAPPWWLGAAFIAAWLAAVGIPLALGLDPGLILFVGFHGWQAPAVGTVLLVMYFYQLARRARMAATARALRLGFRPRVYADDLDGFRDFNLFGLTDDCKRWAGYHYSGKYDGLPVELFDYSFVGKFRTTVDRTVTWPGRQTVFLFPDAAGLPDFHLAPAGSDWGDLIEARLWSLDAGDAVLEVEIDEDEHAVLRGPDGRAIKALFRRDRRDEMRLAPGWTIECHRGRLMLYRDRKAIGPEELPRYLHQVVRIVRGLLDAVPSLPQSPRAPGDDRRVRPDYNEHD